MSRRWAVWILLGGLGVSGLGDQVYLVALNVWMLARTHSAVAVAGLWMVPPLALLLVGSWMGSLADRWDRRFSLVAANLVSAVCVGLIPLVPSVSLIYATLFLLAGANGLFTASLASYVKMLVPRADWVRVSAARGMLVYGSLVLGPALAGVLLLHSSPTTAIWLDAVTFLASAGSLVILPRLNPASAGGEEAGEGVRRWVSDLKRVGTFFRERRVVLGVMAGFSAAVIFGSAGGAEEVVFARNALGLSQSGYGYLVGLGGLGYVAGGFVSYGLGTRLPVRVALGTGVVLSAAGYLLYARSTAFDVAALALALLGMFQSLANVGLSVYLQEALPTEVMGRIMGTTGGAENGLTVLAILAGGLLAHAGGARLMMTMASGAALFGGLWLTVLCLGPGAAVRFGPSTVAGRVSS